MFSRKSVQLHGKVLLDKGLLSPLCCLAGEDVVKAGLFWTRSSESWLGWWRAHCSKKNILKMSLRKTGTPSDSFTCVIVQITNASLELEASQSGVNSRIRL